MRSCTKVTRTATGPGGPGGNGGTGGNGGNGGPGGLATGGDIENTGALLIEGTSSIGSGSLISGSGGIAGFPGIGGILGSGGSGDPDGTDGVDGGTGGLGQPGTTGAAGIAGLDTPGAAIILPTLAYVGKTNALFDLSGISIADSLSGLEMKLVTSSGTLYGTPPGATSVQHGTELVFSGSQTSIDAALTTLEFKANSNGTAKIQIALDDEGGNIAVGTITAQTACFAAGTRITTTRGETEVEDLRNGDLVMTAAGAAPVRWIGHRRIAIAGHPNPRQVRPIRLRRNSLADSVPRRDLLVSPDHALFLDGVLIPARLLVNGATIVQEETFDAIEYFHVELDRHAILLAEGAAAESYLDTGNRGMFDNARGKPTPSIGGQQQRQALSCAELMTDPARVEPLWQLLAVRAMELGFAVSLPRAAGDPELHVLADGRKVAPSARRDGRYTFVLPALTGGARLVSHAAAPCDARPWIEDRRRLGVMVHRLSLRSGAARATIPLDHPALREGWWAMEGDGADVWRWTDGDAVLPETQGTAILEVEVAEAPGDQTGSTLRSCFVTDGHFGTCEIWIHLPAAAKTTPALRTGSPAAETAARADGAPPRPPPATVRPRSPQRRTGQKSRGWCRDGCSASRTTSGPRSPSSASGLSTATASGPANVRNSESLPPRVFRSAASGAAPPAAFPPPAACATARRNRTRRRGSVAGRSSASPCITGNPCATARVTSAMSISMPRASQPLVREQLLDQRAVAAADIEHARAGRDHLGDQPQIDPHVLRDEANRLSCIR